MLESSEHLTQWALQGYCCSQILMLMALEAQGKEDPDMVRAMQGLCGGIGWSGDTCGTLTGAACVVAMYAGKGSLDEAADWQLGAMLHDLVNWFTETYGESFGGIRCREILGDDPMNRFQRCPPIIEETWDKVVEILSSYGYRLDGTGR